MRRYFSLTRIFYKVIKLLKLFISIYWLYVSYSSLFGVSVTSKFIAIDDQQRIVAAKSSFNGTNTDFAIVRYNPDGTLDDTFTSGFFPFGGVVTTDIAQDNDIANSLVIDSNDKIVAGGAAGTGTFLNFAVVRYNPDGSVDPTFAPRSPLPGTVITPIGGRNSVINALILDNGRYLGGGFSFSTFNNFTLARYLQNGSLDNTFNPTGIIPGVVTTSLGSADSIINALTLDSSNRIVAAGSFRDDAIGIARYNNDGTLDTTFNANGPVPGTLTTSRPLADATVTSVIIDNSDRIVLAGYAHLIQGTTDLIVLRFNDDGTIDKTFNPTGLIPGVIGTDIGLQSEIDVSMTIDTNDRIVVSAYTKNIVTNSTSLIQTVSLNFILARYLPEGRLDPSFNPEGPRPGILITDISNQLDNSVGTISSITRETALVENLEVVASDVSNSVILDANNDIVVGGFSNNGARNNDFAIARYLPIGKLDTTFDSGGIQPGVSFTNVFFDTAFLDSPRGPSPIQDPNTVRGAATPAVPLVKGATVIAPTITAPASGIVITASTPIIVGKAPPSSLITIFINNVPVDTLITEASGNWRYRTYELEDNTYSVSAIATDVIGNVSPVSEPLTFTVSATIPKAPQITNPVEKSEVNENTVRIEGKSQSNLIVEIFIDNKLVSEVSSDESGNWLFISEPLSDGKHTVYARVKSVAGKLSPKSKSVSFIVNTRTIKPPTIFSPTHNSLITKPDILIEGVAEQNSSISIYLDKKLIDKVNSDKLGNWSYNLTKLANGQHKVYASITDKALKKEIKSGEISFIVDTRQRPTIINFPFRNNTVIKNNILTLTGKATPRSYVTIYLDKRPIATVVTNRKGIWQYNFVRGPNISLGKHYLSISIGSKSSQEKTLSTLSIILA